MAGDAIGMGLIPVSDGMGGSQDHEQAGENRCQRHWRSDFSAF